MHIFVVAISTVKNINSSSVSKKKKRKEKNSGRSEAGDKNTLDIHTLNGFYY